MEVTHDTEDSDTTCEIKVRIVSYNNEAPKEPTGQCSCLYMLMLLIKIHIYNLKKKPNQSPEGR